jgi:non-specific serine/threonine protein kinase
MRCSFGHFQLDTAERRLLRDGQPVSLTPKALDTLLALVQHAGHAVSKDDLMRAVWPDGFVEETNLAFNISTLRKLLGDGQNGERYIETVPKLGYRFVMPVKMDSPAHHGIAYTKRSNLPAHLTRFIGRVHELEEVTAMVQKRRLVTLTGSGGVGKTRLALEAGGQLLAHFTDGVWLAEFAPLIDETLVPATVAGVFKLHVQTRSLVDMLTDFISEKHMLLIFDNCEHVIDASAYLAETLLRACPNLRILATSREVLRVAGEAVWRVPSMEVPATDILTVDETARYDAVQLFVEHATLVQPGFAFSGDNQEAVLNICRRLDGIPLAIEMAAAQVNAMDVKEIAAGLEHRLDLLTHRRRTAVPRHQTLHATMEWSYNLLNDSERVLLSRLSVFRGGFTAEAAQFVCEGTHQSLMQLVHKSIISIYRDLASGQTRYLCLEVTRQFASEKLREFGATDVTMDRHLDYFLDIAEEPVDFEGPHVDPWLQRMHPEYDNIRIAHATALSRDDRGESAMRLVYAMTRYWYVSGSLSDYENWIEQVYCRDDIELASVGARARLTAARFGLYLVQGRLEEAYVLGEAALALFRDAGDTLGTAWCLEHLANNLFNERAYGYAEEALILFRRIGSRDGEGRALRALGTSAFRAGRAEDALSLLEQSIQVAPWDAVECMWHVYEISPQRAFEIFENAPFDLGKDGLDTSKLWEEILFSTLLLASGEFEWSKKKQKLLLQFIVANGGYGQGDGCLQMLLLGYIEHELECDNAAVEWLDKSLELAGRIPLNLVIFTATFLKAFVGTGSEPLEATQRDTLACLQQFHQYTFRPMVVCAFIQLANVMRRQGHYDKVCRWLGVAHTFAIECIRLGFWMNGLPWLWHRKAQQTIIAPALAAARAALGDVEFERCYAAGQRMTLDEAVALALNG